MFFIHLAVEVNNFNHVPMVYYSALKLHPGIHVDSAQHNAIGFLQQSPGPGEVPEKLGSTEAPTWIRLGQAVET